MRDSVNAQVAGSFTVLPFSLQTALSPTAVHKIFAKVASNDADEASAERNARTLFAVSLPSLSTAADVRAAFEALLARKAESASGKHIESVKLVQLSSYGEGTLLSSESIHQPVLEAALPNKGKGKSAPSNKVHPLFTH